MFCATVSCYVAEVSDSDYDAESIAPRPPINNMIQSFQELKNIAFKINSGEAVGNLRRIRRPFEKTQAQ